MITELRGEYRFLSNFWYCKVKLYNEWYRSVEHAFVAAKTYDKGIRKEIQKIDKPGDVKRFGKTFELRSDWDCVKLGVMRNLLRRKFTKGSELANKLIATGDQEIVEGNNYNDTYWGVCRGVGENNLGKLLMQIREELINGR